MGDFEGLGAMLTIMLTLALIGAGFLAVKFFLWLF